ncbi:MAG: Trm112 family protein [Candidatus Promineifilaceae bacterium]
MQEYLLEILCCPSCHGDLTWSITETRYDHIEEGISECGNCGTTYSIHEGIGVFLTIDDEREDLWQEVESNLMRSIREDPDLCKGLMESPIENLNPADQFFRAMVLEEQGDFAGAARAEETAQHGLYTQEYLDCWKDQVDFLVNQIKGVREPIIDIASGRCYLVEVLAHRVAAPVVASDFSLQVMRRNRRWIEFKGFYHRVSLLVFDARHTPFKGRSIRTMTSNLGLPNIREAGKLHGELRRVVSERFLGISHFYPENDANGELIERYGLTDILYEERLIGGLSHVGFRVDLLNRCRGKAKPTPVGEVVGGAQIDGLPVTEVDLDWCVLQAS